MKTITQKIKEAYAKSWDKKDRLGVAPFTIEGTWADEAAKEHDQAYIRIKAGVTDETYEEADENFRKNLEFATKRRWVRLQLAGIATGIVCGLGWFFR